MSKSVILQSAWPRGTLRLEALALSGTGNPLLLVVTDDRGQHVGEVTLLLGDSLRSARLAEAVNDVMEADHG
jgi:hypothetical protein